MMVMVHNLLFSAITGAAVTIAMSEVAFFFIYRSRRRFRDLTRSRILFEQHYDLRDALLDDEKVPEALRSFVAEISADFENREFARFIARECDSEVQSADPEFASLVDAFRADHLDLFENLSRCLLVGLYATLLRWPETADRASYVMSKVVAAPSRQMVTTVVRLDQRSYRPASRRPELVPAA